MFTVLSRKNFDVRMIMADTWQLKYPNMICTFRDPVLFHLFRVVLDLCACEVGATLPVNESFNVEPKLKDRRN